jgi:hypothetical protein
MAAATGIFLVMILVFALLVPLGIWLLTQRETADRPVMDRESAERSARSDTRESSGDGAATNAWDRRGQ